MHMTPLLPGPLRWTCCAVFAVVLVVHLRHVRQVRGVRRLWHGGHAVMAAGMGCMLVPAGWAVVSAPLWFIGTGGAAVAAAMYALLRHWDGARIDGPWITLVVGLAVMAYMCLMMAGLTVAPMTYLAVAWLVAETLGWFSGALCGRPPGPPAPSPVGSAVAERSQAAAGLSTLPTTAGTVAVRPFLAGPRPLAFAATAADRLVLGLSGLGMACVFVAMQQGS